MQPGNRGAHGRMKKLILNCGLSPGDLVMLTAAIRDLHHWYPNAYQTDVRTVCPDIWTNNPYITQLADDDPEAERVDCRYPLINRCNYTPYHCLHGFIEFLNERFGLSIKPTAFKGDIHLSAQEKAWYSQVHEVTGEDTPFWIIDAGGKHDVTIKWWDHRRYQQVVDHFRGKIQFVQVGQRGHHHPKLEGVIDLRGKTTLRELIRLVYHAHGVLCPVTALMHLTAAVESKDPRVPYRPCVVVAGAREPAHWETYPDHQFIHTNGALPCAVRGGCWKDRVLPLRDGDPRDQARHLCTNVRNSLPRCMDMITAKDVIGRIQRYFDGGALKYLSPTQRRQSHRGVQATRGNGFDIQRLNLSSAGMACDRAVSEIRPYPQGYSGRGIVICGGGERYFPSAWVCIQMLRKFRCRLPIELWHLGDKEVDQEMRALLRPLGVRCVDAYKVRKKFPARLLEGWELKPYAILHCPFREVLLLDADNVPITNPDFLFRTPEFKETGAIFWPDYMLTDSPKDRTIWHSCGVELPNERQFETGQIVVDKKRCWRALSLTMWMNENSDFYFKYVYGDKETFHIAFRRVEKSYSFVPTPIHRLDSTMCQHDFSARRIFQHRNMDKWNLKRNKRIEGFWYEEECRSYLNKLRAVWRPSSKIAGCSSGVRTGGKFKVMATKGAKELSQITNDDLRFEI